MYNFQTRKTLTSFRLYYYQLESSIKDGKKKNSEHECI